MSDATTTPTVDDQVAQDVTTTTTETPAKKPARAKAAPKAKPVDKVTCAGCGKSVELDTVSNVGEQPPIEHHGCAQMRSILHAWWIRLMSDPQAEQPAVTK